MAYVYSSPLWLYRHPTSFAMIGDKDPLYVVGRDYLVEIDGKPVRVPMGMLTDLTSVGHLVLCSSRGLSSARHLYRLRTLYQWADEVWSSSPKVKRRYHVLSN